MLKKKSYFFSRAVGGLANSLFSMVFIWWLQTSTKSSFVVGIAEAIFSTTAALSIFYGPIIDHFSERDIVRIFNETQYCYCYDTQTFYTTIAAVCGCIPIVVPEQGKTRTDYTMGDDTSYGVAYGDTEDEIAYAIATRAQLIDKVHAFKQENITAADYFIAECRRYFYGAP